MFYDYPLTKRPSRMPPEPVPASRSAPCGSPGRQLWPVGLFCSPWPEQALRANIHCQISLALNRIYTEWYPSKGYSFNITNSTSYDQYYVHGRTVFDVMVRLTDDIFNTYIRKTGTVNPYYAEYCDGKSVTCPGLKQWGTVTLANQGRNALSILKYYYGSNIEIIRTNNIQSIPQSYPGSPLRQGSTGAAVFTLQRQLNRITKDYPFLGLLTVDGIFGRKMTETVKKFQKQFNLTADGVVGRSTWYKISYIYVSVKDLAELTSEGETFSGTLPDGPWNFGSSVLKQGSTGSEVEQVQFWLSTLAQYESGIPDFRSVDGLYHQKYDYPPETILSHTFWEERPEEFYRFYRDKLIVKGAKPNAAHLRLAKLEREGRLKAVITQNIDGLHQAAGSRTVYELHGSTLRNYCVKCGAFYDVDFIANSTGVPRCPKCGGIIKPDVVLYEEGLDEQVLSGAVSAIRRADTLIIGGTSLVVYPAAGLIRYFRGDHLVVINMQPTNADAEADLCIAKPIGQVLSEDVVLDD